MLDCSDVQMKINKNVQITNLTLTLFLKIMSPLQRLKIIITNIIEEERTCNFLVRNLIRNIRHLEISELKAVNICRRTNTEAQ